MALFQTSVLKNYLKQLDEKTVSKAYLKYVSYFQNATIQENIRNSKEEQFQATFLNELFVSILGYTLNPNPEFNLTTEFKNQKNNRKADGAILNGKNAVGVIELKGTNTKDLESIRRQAFDYKANQKGCVYVVTSNFEKLRFYINDATEFEEFNLFELTQDRFKLLYLCLQKDNVLNNVPLAVKESSLVEEEKITKRFYADYSLFKRELYRDLVKKNLTRLKSYRKSELQEISVGDVGVEELTRLEKNVKLGLFKKSQKLIDRFLFIFFSEDRGLLPPNSTIQILDKWKADIDFGDERPLYDLFKQYFNFLDTGRQGTTSRAEIYAYNGGLFKPDTVLDNLEISNELLYKHALQLAKYDFESQVDVNILGHIFENSLNEIESINSQIEGAEFDKQKSKRKKDGVFYTPKYITKYIVENTVGKLCDEKKADLGFKEEEYFKGRAKRPKTKILELVQLLDDYRAWLLGLTICDPACGSGAFLNQALDFLIKEHQYIDELKAKILGGGIVFSDIENTILENNIYGVDLNEESVEIAKLSLWLRTAQPRRKLNDLSSNIKCGNSLIDDKKVAGHKAFNWQEKFPKVFEKGGFDAVIGNPPYVRVQFLDYKDIDWLKLNYKTAFKRIDISTLFFERAKNILRENGIVSFITSNQFLSTEYGRGIRGFLSSEFKIFHIIDFRDLPVFDGALTYVSIFTFINSKPDDFKYYKVKDIESAKNLKFGKSIDIAHKNLSDNEWILTSKSELKLLKKLNSLDTLEDYGNAWAGLFTGLDDILMFDENEMSASDIEKGLFLPIIRASDPNKNNYAKPSKYVIYPYRSEDDKTIVLSEEELKNEFPKGYQYLLKNKEALQKRKDSRKTFKDRSDWYALTRFGRKSVYRQLKIVSPGEVKEHRFSLDNSKSGFSCARVFAITSDALDLRFLTIILNSTLIKFYIQRNSSAKAGGYFSYSSKVLNSVPLIIKNVEAFIEKFIHISSVKQAFDNVEISFAKYSQKKYSLIKLSKKLQNWHQLNFQEFIKELNKVIKANNKVLISEEGIPVKVLTKKDEFEWLELFEENKEKAQALLTEIDQIEKKIDQMVYELYGLTQEEIEIVENI